MNSLYWLLGANAAIWLGLGLYVAYLAAANHSLQKRLRHMEMLHEHN